MSKVLYTERRFGEGKYDVSHEFDKNETILEVQVPIQFTARDVDNLIVTAIEGGIRYWCSHLGDNVKTEEVTKPIREGKPDTMPIAQWCTNLLLEGYSVPFVTEDDGKAHYLDLKKFKRGIKLFRMNHPKVDIKDGYDAGDADCVIQYALFGELVYG